jgi:hypothetical protein
MKKQILIVVMIAVSLITSAQTLENPLNWDVLMEQTEPVQVNYAWYEDQIDGSLSMSIPDTKEGKKFLSDLIDSIGGDIQSPTSKRPMGKSTYVYHNTDLVEYFFYFNFQVLDMEPEIIIILKQ